MKILIILAIIAGVFVTQSSGLKCYSCRASDQDHCKIAANLTIEECSEISGSEKFKGMKLYCTNVNTEDGKSFNRGCIKNSGSTDYCDTFKNQSKATKCYVCDTDLCNVSTRIVARLWIAFITVFVILNLF